MTAVEPAPAAAATVFGTQLPLAQRYADWLTGAGTVRGLIGPRETERIWTRHLLNCAVVADLLPEHAGVVDIGSGAGLPGIVLACARPDLQIHLVDSLHRRTDFLTECVTDLELADRVSITNGRVESVEVMSGLGPAQWVTARAVAPLDRLARWCLPLLLPGGQLLAIKGATALQEVAQHAQTIKRLGGTMVDVVECGIELDIEPTRVVVVVKQ